MIELICFYIDGFNAAEDECVKRQYNPIPPSKKAYNFKSLASPDDLASFTSLSEYLPKKNSLLPDHP